ncbi:exosomal polycystin-1-interacting protein-like isoform X2 [Oryzias latipes]
MSPEMSSCAALPWCWLILLSSAPLSINSSNITLLFSSSPYSQSLRNCSCSAAVRDCDELLADSLCQCHSLLRSSLSPGGLRHPGPLHVWFTELWVVEELLNASTVFHLSLSFCGAKPLPSQQVFLLGLRTLRIHSTAPGASYPTQEIRLFPSSGARGFQALPFDLPPPSHISLVDVEVFNGLSPLKAYTVVGPPAAAVSQHFPLLVLPFTQPPQSGSSDTSESPSDPGPGPQKLFFTFVY